MESILKSVSCCLLLIAAAKCSDDPNSVAPDPSGADDKILQIQLQLDRIEELLSRLSESLSGHKPQPHPQPDHRADEAIREEKPEILDQESSSAARIGGPRARIVARYRAAWSDRFQFVAAIRLGSALSCLHVLPHEGDAARYVAAGDESGRLYVFGTHGDLLLDYATLCAAPVTAMVSIALRRNETLLITGHGNGAVLAHRLSESVHPPAGSAAASGGSAGSAAFSASGDDLSTSLSIQYAHSFTASSNSHSTQVVNLEMYRAGRTRYLLVTDASGKIQVFRDNGNLHGTADSSSRPLAFLRSPGTQRLLFLTTTGAASLDLRTMSVRSTKCHGLIANSTFVAYAFAFDSGIRSSRAYGVTRDGDLILVSLSGDTLHFDCHARARWKLDRVQHPVKVHAVRGYILVATPGHVAVYNTSVNSRMSGLRSVLTASMDEISQTFLSEVVSVASEPVLVCDREKLVVVGFGEGYVGIFRSNLPVAQRMQEVNGVRVWGGPVVVVVTVVTLAWYFFSWRGLKGGSSTSTTTTAAAGAAAVAAGSGTGTTQYEKMSEMVMKRGEGGLLDDTRRLMSSPSRVYAPSGGAGFGVGVGAVNYRNTAVDGSY